MSRKDKELFEALKRSFTTSDDVMHGVVVSVDKLAARCSVEVGGQRYDSVSLRSVITNDMGVVFYPAPHSVLFLYKLPGSKRLVVLACSEIESFHIKIEDTELSGNANGVVVKRGAESLKSILADTLDAIIAMTVTTGVGPSGTPINFAEFQQLKSRLNNLLTA